MDEANRVTVKIYGQEYTIAGAKSRDSIMRIADYVDARMHEVSEAGGTVSGVAVLAALNITDDYFVLQKDIEMLIEQNGKLEADTQNYARMWEDVKQSFAQYKQEVAQAGQQRELVQQQYMEKEQQYREKDQQLNTLTTELAETRRRNDTLRARLEEMGKRVEELEAIPDTSGQAVRELEAKCRDIESSFFDIQMENIRLKNELEQLRRQR